MNTISKFSGNYFPKYFLGNDSKWGTPVPIPNTEVKPQWGTPVPIPNTEVKPLNADNSVSEDRKLPRIFLFIETF